MFKDELVIRTLLTTGSAGTPTTVGESLLNNLHCLLLLSGVCRYPAGILACARGMQVPCRYPDVSVVCRHPAGIVSFKRLSF